jgi:hypothetical protein
VNEGTNKRAQKFVPQSLDISLLGGGWAFLLEFSTVIVIIFAIVILGILGVLAGEQISTILAAIAGYVLGKASGGGATKASTEAHSAAPHRFSAPTPIADAKDHKGATGEKVR